MKNSVLISIILATLALGLGYGLNLHWMPALLIAGLGILWLVGQWRRWAWTTTFGLVSFIGLAAGGIWRALPPIWMLIGTVAALAAWDLARFLQRMEQVEQVGDRSTLSRAHLQRLLVVTGLGLLPGGLAAGAQLKLNFGWAVLLGFLMVVSLSWVIGSIKREKQG